MQHNVAPNPADTIELDAQTPSWFTQACDAPLASRFVQAQGCRIHYLHWQAQNDALRGPGILLIHGGGAHANWWRFIAPQLRAIGPVAALDLSGMGDSGTRGSYNATVRAAEIGAVIADAGFLESGRAKPFVVGHSFGGLTGMRYAELYGDKLGGFVIAESPVRPPDLARAAAMKPIEAVTARHYPSYAEAVARFRLKPKQDCAHAYVLEWIARHSVKSSAQGWTWKFDPGALGRDRHAEPFRSYLANARCQTALLFAKQSALCTPAVIEYMTSLLPADTPVHYLNEAQHHLMLDQPLAFVALLRDVLGRWQLR